MNRVMAAAAGVVIGGLPGGAIALGLLEVISRSRRRRRPSTAPGEVAVLLLVLVGAGLPLVPALEAAAGQTAGVGAAVRRSRRLGTAAALAGATGPLAPLLRRLADAATSGSPLEPAIRSYIDAERRQRHTRAVEHARRLPVRLMVPMTLLVLPGFVVMVYGPAFVDLVIGLMEPIG